MVRRKACVVGVDEVSEESDALQRLLGRGEELLRRATVRMPVAMKQDLWDWMRVLLAQATATERQCAALRESNERFRQMTEHSSGLFWMASRDLTKVLYASPAYETIWGRTCESLYADPGSWLSGVHTEDRQHVADVLAGHASSATPWELEYRVVRPDGVVRWVRESGFPICDGSGSVYRIAALSRDVTARKQAEDAFHREHAFSESLIETAQAMVLVLDPQGRVVRLNPFAEQLTGWSRDEVIGKNWFSVCLPKQDQKQVRDRFQSSLDGLSAHGFVNAIVSKTGQVRHVAWHDKVLKNAQGDRVGMLAIGYDVTDRLQAEIELTRSRQMLEDFFVQAPVGLLWISPKGRILQANRAYLELVGCTLNECRGKNVSQFHVVPASCEAMLRRLASRETLKHHRECLRCKDGTIRHVQIDASALWEKRRMVHSGWFVLDISPLVELEREILSISERERHRLGRDLHDDLCQRLATTEFLSEALQRELQSSNRTGARRAKEIGRLIREAITQTRGLANGLCPIELQVEGLRGALRHLARRTRKIFGVVCRFRGETVPIADPQREIHLYRIAQEAINNAIRHGKASRIDVRLKTSNGRLLLGIRDNGLGMSSSRPAH